PTKDGATMFEIWRTSRGDRAEGSGSPPRGPEFSNWWQARSAQIRDVCHAAGCEWIPSLRLNAGGGRGIPTTYFFELARVPQDLAESEVPAEQGSHPPNGIRYRIDPAKPALWIRMTVGSRPFLLNSWRGYIVLSAMALNFLFLGLL